MAQGIQIEEEKIEAVRTWPELKLVKDIQVFLGFANFYRRFIKGFSKIAASLTSMLRTTPGPITSTDKNSDETRGGKIGGGKVIQETGSVKSDKRVRATITKNSMNFLSFEARAAFNRLRDAFTEALILHHFDPKRYIRIETNAFDFAIGGVLSQLSLSNDHVTNNRVYDYDHDHPPPNPTSENGQWYPVAFFSQKMIPAETRNETYNGEFLAIVEAFKTWRHYLKGCKHKVLVLTDHNNFCGLMDTKSLSSRQVWWAQ